MDGHRFDAIAIALGTRRRAVLGALLAGAGAALVGRDPAAARPPTCKAPGQSCRKTAACCATTCARKRGEKRGRCKACADGALYCDGACCPPGEVCLGGACGSACLALQADCTDAAQCCQDGGALACGPIGNLFQGQCCRPLMGACSTPDRFDECCAIVLGGNLVYCAQNHTRGGSGALCTVAATCASGACCNSGITGFCC